MTFTRGAHGILTEGALSLLALALGCVDTSPLHYVPTDASPKASAKNCVVCLHEADRPGPGCGNELTACGASASCKKALTCALVAGCLELGSQVEIVSCGLPCAREAGILAQNDPALTLASSVFLCAAMPPPGCGVQCGSGGPDASE